MDRYKYYRTAKPPIATYGLTAIAAILVFASMIYLRYIDAAKVETYTAAIPFHDDYPPVPTTLLANDVFRFRLGRTGCPSTLVALLRNQCPARIESAREVFRQFSAGLDSLRLKTPALYIINPEPIDPAVGEINSLDPEPCIGADNEALVVRGAWDAINELYRHLDLTYSVLDNELLATACPQTTGKADPWILLDRQGRPKLLFHRLENAEPLVRDYLHFLGLKLSTPP